jgi:hypothetical protein
MVRTSRTGKDALPREWSGAFFHTDLDDVTVDQLGESPLPLPMIADHPKGTEENRR